MENNASDAASTAADRARMSDGRKHAGLRAILRAAHPGRIGGTLMLLLLGASALLAVESPTAGAALGFPATWTLFFLAGAWLPITASGPPSSCLPAVRFVVLATSSGLAIATVVWLLSAHLCRSITPGTLVLLASALAGLMRLLRRTPAALVLPARSWLPLSVGLVALLAGYHLTGINELLLSRGMFFTARFDLWAHVYWAGLVRDLGLPFPEPSGIPGAPLAPLSHLGLFGILAGIQQLSWASPYQSAKILALGCYLLIPLSGILLVRHLRPSRPVHALCALSPLFWGGIVAPIELILRRWSGFRDLYLESVVPLALPAGTLYHNLPQLTAVMLGGAALCALDGDRQESDRTGVLSFAGLLAVSGLVKPVLLLVLGPALLLLLLLDRRWQHALLAGIVLGCGTLLHLAPGLLASLPEAHGWRIDPGRLHQPRTLLHALVAGGLALVVAGACALDLARTRARHSFRWYHLHAVGLGGAVLFALLFFEPARQDHGNQLWPLSAMLVLAAPLTSASLLRWIAPGGTRRRMPAPAVLASLALAAHLSSGVIYASRYPFIRTHWLTPDQVRLAETVAAATEKNASLLVAPELADHLLIYPYLGRRMLPSLSWHPAAGEANALWRAVARGKRRDALDTVLQGRDHVLLGPRNGHLVPLLQKRGWSPIALPGGHTLWSRPAGAQRAGAR